MVAAGEARAQTPEEFYARNKLTIIVGSEEGGSLSLYARLVAKHIRPHIPGNPVIIAQSVAGANGVLAANTFYNRSPRDGSTILLPQKDLLLAQVLDGKQARFDAREFQWIGRMVDYPAVLVVRASSGARTVDDLTRIPVHIGASGRTSQTNLVVYLMNHFLGTKLVSVLGYRGGPDMFLSMERGEIEARLTPLDSLAAQRPDWIKSGYVNIVAQESLVPIAGANYPLIVDLIKDPRGKQMFRLVDSGSLLGFSLAAPPGTPADRVDALRGAFAKVMADPDFNAEARKLQSSINPDTPATLTSFVNDVVGTPADVVDELKRIAKIE
jgi:tripartite-type tricarboxylate transporter receptor subunit TctC